MLRAKSRYNLINFTHVMLDLKVYYVVKKFYILRDILSHQDKAFCDLDKVKHVKQSYSGKFRITNVIADLTNYKESKKDFKVLCSNKKQRYKSQIKEDIIDSLKDPTSFWTKVKKHTKLKTQTVINITHVEWANYFCDLLNQPVNINKDFTNQVENILKEHNFNECNDCKDGENEQLDILNSDFTSTEITSCIKEMASGKSPGSDAITMEMIKSSTQNLVPFLVELFNTILHSGNYPQQWREAFICPLHKKGTIHDPQNYRGISLLCVLGMIFTKALNTRFQSWADNNDINKDEQAGYRKGFSTIDPFFILYAVVSKYISKKKGQMYVCFVDFSKAFDSMPHSLLWYQMMKSGIHGKSMRVMQSMYENLRSCVRTQGGLTHYFDCSVGTRQGCMLSPFLFALYIGELVDMLKKNYGIFITEELSHLI